VANTGAGGKENGTVKQSGVDGTKHYHQKGKRNMSVQSRKGKEEKPDKYLAVEALSSAIRICQDAGFEVAVTENDGLLWFGFPEINLKDGQLSVTEAGVPPKG